MKHRPQNYQMIMGKLGEKSSKVMGKLAFIEKKKPADSNAESNRRETKNRKASTKKVKDDT